MGQSQKSITDYAVYLLLLLAIGLAAFVVLKPAPKIEGLTSDNPQETRKPLPAWTIEDALRYDPAVARHQVVAATNLLELEVEKVAEQTIATLMELKVPSDGRFPQAKKIVSRTQLFPLHRALQEKLIDHQLSGTSATPEQTARVKAVHLDATLRDKELSDPLTPSLVREQVSDLVNDGIPGFYLRYSHLFDEMRTKRESDLLSRKLLDEALQADVTPLVRLDIAKLWLQCVRRSKAAVERSVPQDEYLRLMPQVRQTLEDLMLNYDVIDWSPAECWWEISHRISSWETAEKFYCFRDLWDNEDLDPYFRHMICANFARQLASDYRGIAWASEVEEDDRLAFSELSEICALHLESAWHLAPRHELAPRLLVDLALWSGAGTLPPRLWLSVSMRADNCSGMACDSFAHFLRPRWGGSLNRAVELAVECIKTDAVQSNVPLFAMCMLEDYAEDSPEMDIWLDRRLVSSVIHNAKNLIEYIQSEEGQAEPLFQYRRIRYMTLSLLILNQRFTEAAELAMAVPDPLCHDWSLDKFADPPFVSEMIYAFGGKHGTELAELEATYATFPEKLNRSHLDLLAECLQSDDEFCPRRYFKARQVQIEVLKNMDNSTPTLIQGDNQFAWDIGTASCESHDEGGFTITSTKKGVQDVSAELRLQLPETYSLSAQLEVPEANLDWSVRLQPKSQLPTEFHRSTDTKTYQTVILPVASKLVDVQVRVSGTKATCLVDGKPMPFQNAKAIGGPPSPTDELSICFCADIPLTIRNVVIEPLN